MELALSFAVTATSILTNGKIKPCKILPIKTFSSFVQSVFTLGEELSLLPDCEELAGPEEALLPGCEELGCGLLALLLGCGTLVLPPGCDELDGTKLLGEELLPLLDELEFSPGLVEELVC